ncbi:TonB-dependent receptor [Brevundimonas subvibrioides]|uniref:TonB-dependent receptor n=1 Tax=Brevundimonas subvibrioides TaxID=74313 RepID=UPI0022B36A3B|nr:TonB-dependent receptor [Brevundimonas subvibrioides]
MIDFRTTRTRLLLGCAALAISTPALAQTAPAPLEQPQEDTSQLGDIVVTATRRETNLQDTPISINVVNAEALEQRHVQSLYDLADGAVPSLRVATFEARQSALTVGIRGIVPLDANQPAREQGVGIYIDGVYLARQHGLNAGLFDVERIEVLRGPQGTLFGRNTEGGALNIVTREPSGEFEGRIGGGVGNYGSYSQEIHLDLPEYNNLAFKIDGIVQNQDAVTRNPLAGQAGWGQFNRQGLRAALRWTPTDRVTNIFAYDTATDENTPFYSQLLNYNPNGCVAGTQASQPACSLPGTAYTTLTGTVRPLLPGVIVNGNSRMKIADIGVPQQPSRDVTFGYTNTLRFDITDEVQLRSITAYRGVDATQWDNAGGAHRPPVVVPGCTGTGCNFSRYSLANLHQTQFSQEFQAVGSAGSFDFVAGLFYFKENVNDDAATPNSMAITGYTTAGQTSGYSYVVLDSCIGSGGFGSQPGCRSIDRASEVESTSYAAYGQVTWNVSDALHLTAGGRFTRDTKEGALTFSRNINYATNTAAATANGYKPLDETWERFNPTATVAYDLSEDVHVYAKYATGYRSGGASSRTANYQAFGPEDVVSYEAGFKGDFLDHRARLNVAAYAMDREDSQVDISSIQFTATGSFNNLVTINAPGTTTIRGLEAEFTLRPIDGLTLNASYAYTDTEIPLVPITNCVTAGTPPVTTCAAPVNQQFYIVFTPRNAGSASIDYEKPVFNGAANLRLHFDGNYAEATQAFDQFGTKADESLIFNGRIALADIQVGETEGLTVALWGRNLFNEQYVYRRDPSNSLPAAPTTSLTNGNIGNVMGDYGNFNAPRTFGIEASLRF